MLLLTDELCRQEFDKGLTDKDIHILEPFAGTGTFLQRLLTMRDGDNYLVRDRDFAVKYNNEIHGNEIILLTYYVALVNVTSASFDRPH